LLNQDFKPELLVSTEETLQETARMNQGFKVADRLWLGLFHPARPLVLMEHQIEPLPDPGVSRQVLKQRRKKMQQAEANIRSTAKLFTDLLGKKHLAQFVRDLAAANFKVEEEVYLIPGQSVAESIANHLSALAPHQLVILQISEYETLAKERLAAALQQVKTQDILEETRAMVRLLSQLGPTLPTVTELDQMGDTLQYLLNARQSDEAAKSIDPVLAQRTEMARRKIAWINDRLAGLAYPFKHARGSLSIIEYASDDTHHDHQWVRIMQECNAYSERLGQLYSRIIGRLAVIAEGVETAAEPGQ
jgi:hypothetical protein